MNPAVRRGFTFVSSSGNLSECSTQLNSDESLGEACERLAAQFGKRLASLSVLGFEL